LSLSNSANPVLNSGSDIGGVGGSKGPSAGVPGAACDMVSHPGDLSTGYAQPLDIVVAVLRIN